MLQRRLNRFIAHQFHILLIEGPARTFRVLFKQCRGVVMTGRTGEILRPLTLLVQQTGICIGGQQHLYHILMPVLCREHQRAIAVTVSRIDLSILRDQFTDYDCMTIGCCQHQWRISSTADNVHVCARAQQKHDRALVPPKSCARKGRIALIVP